MPKRTSKRRDEETDDFMASARRVVEATIGEPLIPEKKNPHAVILGRRGGKIGGRARAEKLSAEERRQIALKAARARWSKSGSVSV
jgi:hypothetical protein